MAPPWARISGRAYLDTRKAPRTFTAITASKSAIGGFVDLGPPRDAGAVNQRVDAREAGQGALDLIFVGDVADAAVFERAGGAVHGDDVRAFRGRALRDRQPQARGRARDNDMLSGKSHRLS